MIELHDCFSANELITYEALGLAEEGEAHKLVEAEATTYGGDGPVVNPSGGLISKGHPLGATGLAQCSELTWQLRGQADKRQVEGAKTGLQHNIGIGGAVVVTLYQPGEERQLEETANGNHRQVHRDPGVARGGLGGHQRPEPLRGVADDPRRLPRRGARHARRRTASSARRSRSWGCRAR